MKILGCLALALAFVPRITQAANACVAAVPDGVREFLSIQNSNDVRSLVEWRMYQKDYANHDEAISDGFEVGARVYNIPLKVGGQFDKKLKDEWMSEHKESLTRRFSQAQKSGVDSSTINVEALREIRKCVERLQARGVGGRLDAHGDCSFDFTAWYSPNSWFDFRPGTVGTLTVTGGTCEPWNISHVPLAGHSVHCYRSNRDALSVTLNTKKGVAQDDAEALPDPGPKPKPPEKTPPKISPETITAPKLTNQKEDPVDLGAIKLPRSFIVVPLRVKSGRIISARFVGQDTGAHHWPCPDGQKCLCFPSRPCIIECPAAFTPVSDTEWKYCGRTDDAAQANLTFEVSVETPERCPECPAYEKALLEWTAREARTCGKAPVGTPQN